MSLLLDRARGAGLTLAIENGRLAIEGPEDAEAMALELLAAEGEVLAALAGEASESAEPAWPATDAVVWLDEQVPAPHAPCRCCRRRAWWRLRRVSTGRPGSWLCGWCHPPLPPKHEIEWHVEPAAGEERAS